MECHTLNSISIWNRKIKQKNTNVRSGLVVGMDTVGLDVNILAIELVTVNGVTVVGLTRHKIHTQNVNQNWIVPIAGSALETVILFIIFKSVFFLLQYVTLDLTCLFICFFFSLMSHFENMIQKKLYHKADYQKCIECSYLFENNSIKSI